MNMTMTMYMNMCIIMNMNIYISKENEEYIRNLSGSMSGYINTLIKKDREENLWPPKPTHAKLQSGVVSASASQEPHIVYDTQEPPKVIPDLGQALKDES